MDIVNAASARATFYDRNPIPLGLNYNSSLAPHGLTVRWSYTVPVGKKFLMAYSYAYGFKSVLAGAPGPFRGQIRVTPVVGAVYYPIWVYTYLLTLGDVGEMNGNTSVAFLPGDVIEGLTQDTNGGGNILFSIGMSGTEFDY